MAVNATRVMLTALMSRGQPERWNSAERTAVEEKEEGDTKYDIKAYNSARQKAIYNQKNGWTDDGSERTGKDAPLRNNAKRGGDQKNSNSDNQESDNDACLDSFTQMSVVCGNEGGDMVGGDEDDEWGEFWDLGLFFSEDDPSSSEIVGTVSLG